MMVMVLSLFIGCTKSDIPADSSELCDEAPTDFGSAGFKSEAELQSFLAENKVDQVNPIALSHLVQFSYELKKMPAATRRYLAKLDARYRILSGKGVSEDPEFKWTKTSDTRYYAGVAGAASAWTWTVVNKLYSGSGINLVLHERAHTVDAWGVPGLGSSAPWFKLSSSPEWEAITKEDGVYRDIANRACGEYCNQSPREGFAEVYAMYHACPASRALVQRSPRLVQFFESIEAAALNN